MTIRRSLACGLLLAVAAVLSGCPSKGGERQDAQTSSSSGALAQGPLASLETSNATTESWSFDEGPSQSFLYYSELNLRVSASCKQASGKLACDAIRFLRGGTPVEIARRFLDGRQSAGVKACMRMNQPIVVAHNAVGAEDSFCKFPDGSLLAAGALERYGMRVIE